MNENIICCVCGNMFTWSHGEQNFFARKGLSKPRRCKACRQAVSAHQTSVQSTQAAHDIFSPSSLNKPLLSVETQHINENKLTQKALALGKEAKIKAKESEYIFNVVFAIIFVLGFSFLKSSIHLNPLLIIVALVIAAFVLLFNRMLTSNNSTTEEEEWKDPIYASGAEGEDLVLNKLKSFSKNMIIFNQREVPNIRTGKKPCEIDFILLHECGISILEIKHTKGYVYGLESDNLLKQQKVSSGNLLYENEIPNPTKQLAWQVRTLQTYLKSKALHVPTEGFVVFSNQNCELDIPDRKNIITFDELDESVLQGNRALNPKVIRAIEQVLSKL